jgi:hypothetical protein
MEVAETRIVMLIPTFRSSVFRIFIVTVLPFSGMKISEG